MGFFVVGSGFRPIPECEIGLGHTPDTSVRFGAGRTPQTIASGKRPHLSIPSREHKLT